MDLPTMEDVRAVKTEIIALLKNHQNFMGAGIGQRDGRLVVRVNWRALPAETKLPDHIGRVEIEHFETGAVRPHGD